MATDLDILEYEHSLIYEVRSDMAVGGATKLRDAHEKLKRANHLGFDEAADGSMLVVYLRFFGKLSEYEQGNNPMYKYLFSP